MVTSLSFGPVVLGGNVFGWTVGPDDAFAVLDAFLDGGGRAIDTADSYMQSVPGNVGGEKGVQDGVGVLRTNGPAEHVAAEHQRSDLEVGRA